MPTTGSGKWPYPNSSAVPDVPADVLLLAQRIDLMSSGWTITANATTRAALVTNSDAYEGLRVWQIDTKTEYLYTGSAWVPWNSDWITWATAPSNLVVGTGGSASTFQRYKYVTGRILFEYAYTLGSSGQSVSSSPVINLPVSIRTPTSGTTRYVGSGNAYDLSATSAAFPTILVGASATTVTVRTETGAGIGAGINSTAPFTWAAGDQLGGEFWADPA